MCGPDLVVRAILIYAVLGADRLDRPVLLCFYFDKLCFKSGLFFLRLL